MLIKLFGAEFSNHHRQLTKNKSIKRNYSAAGSRRIALIKPGISKRNYQFNKVSGTIIKWKIKIAKISNYNNVAS